MNVGAVYLSIGQFEKADEYFLRGLQLAPHNADLYSNAGTASFFLGHFEEDVAYCKKALEITPQKYDYWGNLADGYRMIPWPVQQRCRSLQASHPPGGNAVED